MQSVHHFLLVSFHNAAIHGSAGDHRVTDNRKSVVSPLLKFVVSHPMVTSMRREMERSEMK